MLLSPEMSRSSKNAVMKRMRNGEQKRLPVTYIKWLKASTQCSLAGLTTIVPSINGERK
jgi:hypothetical protein